MAVEKPRLSLLEKATYILVLLRALGVGLISLFTALFRGKSGSAKYRYHVLLAMGRTLMNHTTVRQNQYFKPDLDDLYPAFAKKQGFTPKNVTLADGTKAYWLGDPSVEKVILYFHGGGYNFPPEPGHLTFVASLTSPSVSALMLSYTLAPHATYPRQLQQAVALLRHTVTALHRSPNNVILAGDSAGANLTLGLLSHLLHPHPHPDIKPLTFGPGAKLGAAILMAPWVHFGTGWPSMKENARKDVVTVSLSQRWSASFLGGRPKDAYNEPLSAPADWWVGLEDVLAECLVVGGGEEILADVIVEMGRRLEKVLGDRATVVLARGEFHVMPVLSKLERGCEQREVIWRFLRERS